MNELIKELAEQAHDYCIHSGEVINYDDAFEQKFAELLLEEVMQTLFINGYEDAFDMLNEHFGVKE